MRRIVLSAVVVAMVGAPAGSGAFAQSATSARHKVILPQRPAENPRRLQPGFLRMHPIIVVQPDESIDSAIRRVVPDSSVRYAITIVHP